MGEGYSFNFFVFHSYVEYYIISVYRLLMKPGIHDVRRSRLSSVGEVGELDNQVRIYGAKRLWDGCERIFTHYQRLTLRLSMAWRCDQS
jgi:hypothetical protein